MDGCTHLEPSLADSSDGEVHRAQSCGCTDNGQASTAQEARRLYSYIMTEFIIHGVMQFSLRTDGCTHLEPSLAERSDGEDSILPKAVDVQNITDK